MLRSITHLSLPQFVSRRLSGPQQLPKPPKIETVKSRPSSQQKFADKTITRGRVRTKRCLPSRDYSRLDDSVRPPVIFHVGFVVVARRGNWQLAWRPFHRRPCSGPGYRSHQEKQTERERERGRERARSRGCAINSRQSLVDDRVNSSFPSPSDARCSRVPRRARGCS